MEILAIDGAFSICKVMDDFQLKENMEYCFTGKTDEEYSLVCLTKDVPAHTIAREDGWRAFRIQGVLDFSLIGILAGITALLAEKGIGVFVISTFQTDYVLVKSGRFREALEVLSQAGYRVTEQI